MNEEKNIFLQRMIALMPMTGKSIPNYEKEMGLGSSTLYFAKNGYRVKEELYNNILEHMLTKRRKELAKIMAVLTITDKDIENLEETIESYFDILENESTRH